MDKMLELLLVKWGFNPVEFKAKVLECFSKVDNVDQRLTRIEDMLHEIYLRSFKPDTQVLPKDNEAQSEQHVA